MSRSTPAVAVTTFTLNVCTRVSVTNVSGGEFAYHRRVMLRQANYTRSFFEPVENSDEIVSLTF